MVATDRTEKTGEAVTTALEIMIVDDEPTVGRRLAPVLAKLGCEVETFVNPREAMRRLDEKTFDIVITDVVMKEATGVQVLEHVTRKTDHTKVIIITGFAMMSLAREAMDKGAFDFLAKPFHLDDLRGVVAKAAEALGAPLEIV